MSLPISAGSVKKTQDTYRGNESREYRGPADKNLGEEDSALRSEKKGKRRRRESKKEPPTRVSSERHPCR